MTELLQQVIAQIEKLPLDRQEAFTAWLLAELQNEKNVAAIEISDDWTEKDRSDITNFSLQCADSNFK
jgi:hypothetical protein